MFTTLMTSRRFAPLFWCQFLSAFNDNFLKNSLVFLILFKLAASDAEALISLAGAVFIFPFFIISALGGQIADKFDKAFVAEKLKLIEIGIAAVAVAGFWWHSIPILFVALFLFGCNSALFGPIKYGILPDHLAIAELPTGNALIEGATFVAILTGTIVGGLAAKDGGDPAVFGAMMMVFAVACWATARFIPPSGRGAPELTIDLNVAVSTFSLLGALKSDKRLWWGGLVVSWFWLVGAVMLTVLPSLVKNGLGGNEEVVTAFLAIFSVAIAIGSGLASYLAAGRIMLTPTLAAAVLLGVFALDLGYTMYGVTAQATMQGIAAVFSSERGLHVAIDMAGLAVAGGLFIVPAFSAVQAWAGHAYRARVIAAINVLNAAFMTVAGLIVAVLLKAGLSLAMLLLALGIANVAVAVAIAKTMPTLPASKFKTSPPPGP